MARTDAQGNTLSPYATRGGTEDAKPKSKPSSSSSSSSSKPSTKYIVKVVDDAGKVSEYPTNDPNFIPTGYDKTTVVRTDTGNIISGEEKKTLVRKDGQVFTKEGTAFDSRGKTLGQRTDETSKARDFADEQGQIQMSSRVQSAVLSAGTIRTKAGTNILKESFYESQEQKKRDKELRKDNNVPLVVKKGKEQEYLDNRNYITPKRDKNKVLSTQSQLNAAPKASISQKIKTKIKTIGYQTVGIGGVEQFEYTRLRIGETKSFLTDQEYRDKQLREEGKTDAQIWGFELVWGAGEGLLQGWGLGTALGKAGSVGFKYGSKILSKLPKAAKATSSFFKTKFATASVKGIKLGSKVISSPLTQGTIVGIDVAAGVVEGGIERGAYLLGRDIGFYGGFASGIKAGTSSNVKPFTDRGNIKVTGR